MAVMRPPPPPSLTKFISDHPYLSMLETKCTSIRDFQKLHTQLIKSGLAKHPVAASRLLSFTATSPAADIRYAYLLFSRIQNPNIFIWNTIIRAFSHSSTPLFSIQLFIQMLINSPVQPQRLTYPSLFKACAHLRFADFGAQLHARVFKSGLASDTYILNSLIHMYAVCGFLDEAYILFDASNGLDVVAWNSMIIGLAKNGCLDRANELFDEMPARLRNMVSWNSMISGYVRNGKWEEALDLFNKMQEHKINPTDYTLVSLLNAAANLGALKQGEWIHDYIEKNRVQLNAIVSTAIINMYCKCGSITKACQVFDTSPAKGLSCWNSMIIGLATNGRENEAIKLFSKLESSNLEPNSVSFIGILTACNHAGLVDEAKDYFRLMTRKYRIEPTIKHCGCIIDLLGRAGHLEEAQKLIISMNMNPDAIIYGSLLSSCRTYRNAEIGSWAQKHLMELDSDESSSHVLMCSVYAASGEFDKVIEERDLMRKKGIEKQPGCSLIEVDGEVHEFIAGGKLHPRAAEIYSVLNELSLVLKDIEFAESGKYYLNLHSEIVQEYIVAS